MHTPSSSSHICQTCEWGHQIQCTPAWSVAELCLTLCDPMDCGLPGSSVCGISQARILEWVAALSFKGSSQTRAWTSISYISCISRQVFFLPLAPHGKPHQMQTSPRPTCCDHRCMTHSSLKLEEYWGSPHVPSSAWLLSMLLLLTSQGLKSFSSSICGVSLPWLACIWQRVACHVCAVASCVEHATLKVCHQGGSMRHPPCSCTSGTVAHRSHMYLIIPVSIHRVSSVHLHTLKKMHTPGPAQLCGRGISVCVKDSACTRNEVSHSFLDGRGRPIKNAQPVWHSSLQRVLNTHTPQLRQGAGINMAGLKWV